MIGGQAAADAQFEASGGGMLHVYDSADAARANAQALAQAQRTVPLAPSPSLPNVTPSLLSGGRSLFYSEGYTVRHGWGRHHAQWGRRTALGPGVGGE